MLTLSVCFTVRYVVCSGYKDMERELYNYLFTINEEINELKLADPENEINEVIPRETMMKDEAFVKYVTASNTRFVPTL